MGLAQKILADDVLRVGLRELVEDFLASLHVGACLDQFAAKEVGLAGGVEKSPMFLLAFTFHSALWRGACGAFSRASTRTCQPVHGRRCERLLSRPP